MQLNVVVFPHPLGPINPTSSPCDTWKEILSTARKPPKSLVRSDKRSAGSDIFNHPHPRLLGVGVADLFSTQMDYPYPMPPQLPQAVLVYWVPPAASLEKT